VLPRSVGGEALLDWLARGPFEPRPDLVGTANLGGGSAGQHGAFLEVGDVFVKASASRRYPRPDVAIECEWRDEVLRQELGIYHPDRVWFLSRGADQAFWACSVTPILPVLRERLNSEPGGPSEASWSLYLATLRLALELAQKEDVLLDCNPNNFGLAGERIFYIDDDIASRSGRMPFGHQVLLRLQEYAHGRLEARLAFLDGFRRLIQEVVTEDRLRRQLLEDLEPGITWPGEPELRALLDAVVDLLRKR